MSSEIPLAVVGWDYRGASTHWRTRLILDESEVVALADHLEAGEWADGLVNLATCNRNEWIVSSSRPRWAAELVQGRMMALLGKEGREQTQPYLLVGAEAARHVFRVAIGQESLVQGERQIATQLFNALESARSRGTSSRVLNGLGNIAGRLVRVAIRRGCVGTSSVGVHSLAIRYLFRHLAERPQPWQVAVVGMGAIGRRVAAILDERPEFTTVRANRTVPDCDCGVVRPLSELPGILARVDAAVVCTGARLPVVRPEHLADAGALVVVDVGIPEQVVRTGIPDEVRVFGLDQLTTFHHEGAHDTADHTCEADDLVSHAVDEFVGYCNKPTFAQILAAVHDQHRRITHEDIPRLLEGELADSTKEQRAHLEHELRAILADYTNEVIRTVQEASVRAGDHPTWTA